MDGGERERGKERQLAGAAGTGALVVVEGAEELRG